jgi:hypothetical protein
VTDQSCWEHEDDTFDWADPKAEADEARVSFDRTYALLRERLVSYRIIQSPKIQLDRFPVQYRGARISCEAIATYKSVEDPSDRLESVSVVASSISSGKKKRIMQIGGLKAVSCWISGSFRSPFEDRIDAGSLRRPTATFQPREVLMPRVLRCYLSLMAICLVLAGCDS